MLTFSTENTLRLEPKSPPRSLACSTIYFLLTSRSLQPTKRLAEVNARTKQYLLCKTKPISEGLLTTVTSALTSTYEHKPPLEAPKNKANSKPIGKKTATLAKLHQIPNTRYEIRDTILRAYKAPLAGVPPLQANRAHKTIPFMQNKANLPTPANEPNLSSNKALRRKTTPEGPKKQSQFPKRPKTSANQVCTKAYENKPRSQRYSRQAPPISPSGNEPRCYRGLAQSYPAVIRRDQSVKQYVKIVFPQESDKPIRQKPVAENAPAQCNRI